MKRRSMILLVALIAGATVLTSGGASLAESRTAGASANLAAASAQPPMRYAPCVDGMAGEFPCENVDLLSYLTMEELGGGTAVGTGRGSDVWGWQDPVTRREYAIAGRENGTAFVDITDPLRPVYLANLPTASTSWVIWRDIKVFKDHAFIVSEAANHGMQVFDLTQLRDIDPDDAPVDVTATTNYTRFGRSHNININEDTGFAYAVGINAGEITCSGGLHSIDINDPANPTFAGCIDTSVHDTQCVVYHGPDVAHRGSEICINSRGGQRTVAVWDVDDKANPVRLSQQGYPDAAFSHQGWLTEDHRYFVHSDEGDEGGGRPTRTRIWDVRDLDAIKLIGVYEGTTESIDHNLYIRNKWVFQSNYKAGLQILDASRVARGELEQVGFFDVYPPDNTAGFGFGSWSNYPWFRQGVVAVHGYQGLWLVKPNLERRQR